MTKTQRIIMWYLLRPGTCTFDDLVNHLYADDPDGGPLAPIRIVSQFVWHARTICPITIHTAWGIGYYIEDCDRDAYHNWLITELKDYLDVQEKRRLPHPGSTSTHIGHTSESLVDQGVG